MPPIKQTRAQLINGSTDGGSIREVLEAEGGGALCVLYRRASRLKARLLISKGKQIHQPIIANGYWSDM